MNADHVVTAAIIVNPARYPNAARRQQFFDDLAARLRSNPLVSHAAVSDTSPPYGFIHNLPFSVLQPIGKPPLPQGAGGNGVLAFRVTWLLRHAGHPHPARA